MYDMEYRIIRDNWKYRIQYRKRFWFWTNLPVITENVSFGGIFSLCDIDRDKEFESYQGALQYLRQYLGRDVTIKETRLI